MMQEAPPGTLGLSNISSWMTSELFFISLAVFYVSC
jgi:hypothetical protein